MQSGQDKFGMQTFNQALASAYFKKEVSIEVAMQRSSNQDELQEMINRGAGLVNRPTAAGSVLAKGAAPAKR
jgi:twitching motility protein PilT